MGVIDYTDVRYGGYLPVGLCFQGPLVDIGWSAHVVVTNSSFTKSDSADITASTNDGGRVEIAHNTFDHMDCGLTVMLAPNPISVIGNSFGAGIAGDSLYANSAAGLQARYNIFYRPVMNPYPTTDGIRFDMEHS